MKDLVITSKALKRELFVLLGCFLASFCLNIYAVLHYSRPASELVSQIGYVLVCTVVIYILLWLLRLIILLVRQIVKKFS